MDSDSAQRFEERIRNFLSERTGGGENITHIQRLHVEQIGEELGMNPREACTQFFALRGSVWDVSTGNLQRKMDNTPDNTAPPPRDWFAIHDIYLVT